MLGVKHGIVVLNKVDLVDDEMLELAELEIAEFIEGTSLEGAPCGSSLVPYQERELINWFKK